MVKFFTYANVFVGDRAPFDLLLGRPWQRGNFISIDERHDGTYLLFKDKQMTVKYELLVSPEVTLSYDPEVADYLAKTHGFLSGLKVFAALSHASVTGQMSVPETQSQQILRRFMYNQEEKARQVFASNSEHQTSASSENHEENQDQSIERNWHPQTMVMTPQVDINQLGLWANTGRYDF